LLLISTLVQRSMHKISTYTPLQRQYITAKLQSSNRLKLQSSTYIVQNVVLFWVKTLTSHL